MHSTPPRCLIMAGPNGAGKSTHAAVIVSGLHGIDRYINPDTIASGLAAFSSGSANFDAGRIALQEIDKSIEAREDFAFETTLSGRRWPNLLDRLDVAGFHCSVAFLWLPTVDLSISRVRRRVLSGGHDIPLKQLQRRHTVSIANFQEVFQTRVHDWRVFDASVDSGLVMVAQGGATRELTVFDAQRWSRFVSAPRARDIRERALIEYRVTNRGMPMLTTQDLDDIRSGRRWATSEEIAAVSPGAIRRALAVQRALGVGAAVLRDGKVVIIPPDQLPLTATDEIYAE